MSDTVNIPLHYPCAARVKMPQIGSEDSEIGMNKSTIRHNSSATFHRTSLFEFTDKLIRPVEKMYINDASEGLKFSEDVVRDRCFHMLPYDEKYFWEAMDVSGLIPVRPKKHIVVRRHSISKPDKSHVLSIPYKPKAIKPLKPLKRELNEKALKMHKEIAQRLEREKSKDIEASSSNGVFMTEVAQNEELKDTNKTVKLKAEAEPSLIEIGEKEKRNDWDAYLMSMISPMTANWIVHQKMTGSGVNEKEDLSKLLESWYGKPEHTDLIRDDVSETEMSPTKSKMEEKPKKKWQKEEAVLLEKVLKSSGEAKARDPYSDENEAPFYRQPTGFRKQKKKEEKEEMGAINSTARAIEVKTYTPPPPPTLKDFFNPKSGKTLIETDNMFEREWLTGNEQIFQGQDEEDKIVMSSQNKYSKQLQTEYPGTLNTWYKQDTSSKPNRPTKGGRRWKSLPEPVDDTADILKCIPPGTEQPIVVSSDAKTKKVKEQNSALSQIIDEWRTKWQLSGQFADSSPDDLLRDMADIQPHVRLKAIATVAKAAEYKPPMEDGIQLEYYDSMSAVRKLPEFIFEALNCLLEDKHDQVQKASAITLYSLNKPSEKAEDILRELLFSESLADRWAAAQCLAHFGVCDSDIAGEVIRQLLETEDSIKHEQAIQLLAKMSAGTTLIHSMVAEQLNSSSWRHRVIACKIFPTLDGNINKDIANKLSYLMWNDWHIEVRKASAQALGKTGHGRTVHDDLKEKIQGADERLKIEAISRVGHLGIMTAKLLPAILDCFNDEYISVRMEVCITCGNLLIKDQQVLDKLLNLATFDPTWKVKALAIQALGKIGVSTPEIIEGLLWALRYEEEAGVRAEACHSLQLLGYKDEEFIEILQERLLVEDSDVVKEEMKTALCYLGLNTSDDIDTVAQIKDEVRKLCDQSNIACQIISNDKIEERKQTLSRMIYTARQELDKEETPEKTEPPSETWNVRTTSANGQKRGRTPTQLVDREVEAILAEHKVEPRTPETSTRRSSQSSSVDDELDSVSHRSWTSMSVKSHMDKIPEVSDEFDDGKWDVEIHHENMDRSPNFTRENTTVDRQLTSAETGSRLEDKLGNLMVETGFKSPFTPNMDKRASIQSMSGSALRRHLASRETLREKEMINAEAKRSLITLNARYSSMMESLKKVDDGFSAALSQTKPREDTEEIISNIPIKD